MASLQETPAPRGVRLKEVYEPNGKTDIDIIAIHGLDTTSAETWVWKPRDNSSHVNWLSDEKMLPSRVGNASIWTCDWQADLILPAGQEPKTAEELARDVLACLEAHIRDTGPYRRSRE
ncbi:hypothetical protein B0I35DRAFT_412761 [Stachybotrys elegans]|uniref:Uncharacterized protein n=1 Tax=Stachybotrys elegans TaxID=80388 RepID=A0A8K0SKI3_9HYPO|nr:hypothetical protein B0I35DRAFT_412761 [Stachybotrys elegans]